LQTSVHTRARARGVFQKNITDLEELPKQITTALASNRTRMAATLAAPALTASAFTGARVAHRRSNARRSAAAPVKRASLTVRAETMDEDAVRAKYPDG
jgi:hypothetical protein